jgi:hypothetical protein
MLELSEHLIAETDYSWANVGAAVTNAGVVLIAGWCSLTARCDPRIREVGRRNSAPSVRWDFVTLSPRISTATIPRALPSLRT